jgi:hypothetical protein
MKLLWKRILAVLVFAAGAATGVGLLAELAGLGDKLTYGLSGALIALLAAFGVPFAFGWGDTPFRGSRRSNMPPSRRR